MFLGSLLIVATPYCIWCPTEEQIRSRIFALVQGTRYNMGWLRLVGSLKTKVSFAKEPYKRDCILVAICSVQGVEIDQSSQNTANKQVSVPYEQANESTLEPFKKAIKSTPEPDKRATQSTLRPDKRAIKSAVEPLKRANEFILQKKETILQLGTPTALD